MSSIGTDQRSPRPEISVLIPTFNRYEELRRCLEGFSQQTIQQNRFEVIVVDDGSTTKVESLAGNASGLRNLRIIRLCHAGVAIARNTAIKGARAPLLLLYDDDLCPLRHLLEYCLDFHRVCPAEHDTALLHFGADPAMSSSAFSQWAFATLYPFPRRAGVGSWGIFWSGTLTAKKSLFRHGLFDPAYQMAEDTELGLRLSRKVTLRVHFEPGVTGILTRRLTLEQVCWRQYTLGYFSRVLVGQYHGLVNASRPPFNCPESYVIRDFSRLAAMIVSARAMELEVNNNRDCLPQSFRILQALWSNVELHTRAEGWLAAQNHQTLNPPGTVGMVLKER